MVKERSREETLSLRARLKAEAEASGLTEAFISDLVDRFYDRIQVHPELGPIFNDRIDDWPPHLTRMKQFWTSIAHHSGEYKGNPMRQHVAMGNLLTPALFDAWLSLFQTVLQELTEDQAMIDFFMFKAGNIARSLQLGLKQAKIASTA